MSVYFDGHCFNKSFPVQSDYRLRGFQEVEVPRVLDS
jgi:hypothetical protein